MARHLATTGKLGTPAYFCNSRSPWQRGSNENINGLLQGYFPKDVSIAGYLPAHLLASRPKSTTAPRRPQRPLPRRPIRHSSSLLQSVSVARLTLEPTSPTTDQNSVPLTESVSKPGCCSTETSAPMPPR